MTLDIRATVTCNIGPLISASISDDYIQGSGLVKVTGSCEIAGIYTPAPGDIVTFSYTKSGITRRIPRTLRVLSSFADPFKRITSIELGCKLTYLQDLKDPINWDAFDDPQNADRLQDEAQIVTIPIWASSVMDKCLSELDITATSNPLTNAFSIAEFDFSSGYVNILSDLLVSECYCGYLDINEKLVIFNLNESGGSGPLVDSQKLIDIGPIGVGQLPGDAVVVSYSTLKLALPDGSTLDTPVPDPTDPNYVPPPSVWGSDFAISQSTGSVALSWTNKETQASVTQVIPTLTTSTTTTYYRLIYYDDENGKRVNSNVVDKREKKETKSTAAIAGNLYSQYLSNNISVSFGTTTSTETEYFTYDNRGQEVEKLTERTASAIEELGSLGLDMVFPDGYVSISNIQILTEREIVKSQRYDNYEYSKTVKYVRWPKTIQGQQAIAAARDSINSATACSAYINKIYALGLQLNEVLENSQLTGSRTQTAPLPAEIANAKNSDSTGNPDNGYRTESKSEVELVSGSSSAKRRIEFTLPYAPDDIFVKVGTSYVATASDAPAKAKNFGIVQNRMLLGNRSGMNIQTSPEYIPNDPFSPIFTEAGGVVALYRLNGTSWAIDSNGIIVSSDAMFWGTAGRTS